MSVFFEDEAELLIHFNNIVIGDAYETDMNELFDYSDNFWNVLVCKTRDNDDDNSLLKFIYN